MIGVETALADDPALTVRLPGLDRKPWRVVLDTHLRLPTGSRLARTARDLPTLVISGPEAPKDAAARLADCGVVVERVGLDLDGHVDLAQALRALAARGVTRVFSEGGPRIAGRLIDLGLADDVVLITARKAAGASGAALAQRAGARRAPRRPALCARRSRGLWTRRHAAVRAGAVDGPEPWLIEAAPVR